MPIYEYHCDNCGADLEIFQHMADPTLKLCPQCKAEGLAKVFSPVGIVFKGSGFYATDHKNSKSAAALGPGSHADTTGESKTASAGKPEATPAPKADTSGSTSASSAPSSPTPSSGDKKGTSSSPGDN